MGKMSTEKISLFRINEIGKSRVVLRLYTMTGAVSLNPPVMAGYGHPVFNLVVVAQRKTRNTRKKDGTRRTSHCICRYLSRIFRSFPLFWEFFGPKLAGRASHHWYLPFVIG